MKPIKYIFLIILLLASIYGFSQSQQSVSYNLVCWDSSSVIRTLKLRTYEVQGLGSVSEYRDLITNNVVVPTVGIVADCAIIASNMCNTADTSIYTYNGTIPDGVDRHVFFEDDSRLDFVRPDGGRMLYLNQADSQVIIITFNNKGTFGAKLDQLEMNYLNTGIFYINDTVAMFYEGRGIGNRFGIEYQNPTSSEWRPNTLITKQYFEDNVPEYTEGLYIDIASDVIGVDPSEFAGNSMTSIWLNSDTNKPLSSNGTIINAQSSYAYANTAFNSTETFNSDATTRWLGVNANFYDLYSSGCGGCRGTFALGGTGGTTNGIAARSVRIGNLLEAGDTVDITSTAGGVLYTMIGGEDPGFVIAKIKFSPSTAWHVYVPGASADISLYSANGVIAENRVAQLTGDSLIFLDATGAARLIGYNTVGPKYIWGFQSQDSLAQIYSGSNEVGMFSPNIGEFSFDTNTDKAVFNDTRATKLGFEYLADYSAGILGNARSIPDVGIVNALISDSLGSLSLPTIFTSSGSITGNNNIDLDMANFLSWRDNDDVIRVRWGNLDEVFETWTKSEVSHVGANATELYFKGTTVGGLTLDETAETFVFEDERAGGSQAGIEYAADYSADFTDRSLIDKGYADAAYAPAGGADFVAASTNTNSWRAATYGKGIFVAVSSSGTDRVMTSVDGLNWTVVSTPGDANNWETVAYGNGLFVALATTGTDRVMTSTDGVNWVLRDSPGDASAWQKVIYDGSRFVAVAQWDSVNPEVMHSVDGINWTTALTGSNRSPVSIAYNGSIYVIACETGSGAGAGGRILTSTDLVTFTQRSSSAQIYKDIIWAKNLFIVVGISSFSGGIITSPDGITWTNRTPAGGGSSSIAIYGDNLYAIMGDAVSSPTVAISDNGTSWSLADAQLNTASTWVNSFVGNGLLGGLASTGPNRVEILGTPVFSDRNQAAGDWGTQYVFTDNTLTGKGLPYDPLTVDLKTFTIADHYADSTNVDTDENDLYIDTLAANLLSANGQKLKATYSGTFTDATATADMRLYFGATEIFDSGVLTLTGTGVWSIEVLFIRSGTTTARAIVTMQTDAATVQTYAVQTDLTTQDFTVTNELKLTGEADGAGGGAGDIVAKLGTVQWLKQAE